MDNQRRSKHDRMHKRDFRQRPVWRWHRPSVIAQQQTGVGSGLKLTVNTVFRSLHLLLDLAVKIQNHLMKLLIRIHEVGQLQPFFVVRYDQRITLHVPPVMIPLLDHFQQLLPVMKIRMGDLFDLQHLHHLQ